MAEYMLHCFAQSGNCYKPALMLELAGADWSPRFVDYFNGETRTPAYRALNVMGEVPVLEHRGLTAVAVGRHPRLPRRNASGQFGPDDDDERREILRWLLFDNHKLTSYTATYRFMRAFATNPEPAVLAEFRKRAETAWGVLDAHLKDASTSVGRPARRSPISRLSATSSSTTRSASTGAPDTRRSRIGSAGSGRSRGGCTLRADAGPPAARSRLESLDATRCRARVDERSRSVAVIGIHDLAAVRRSRACC